MRACTQDQIRIVKKTWSFFRNMSPEFVGDVFYTKLFMDHPDLEKRYPKEPQKRYEDLIKMLNMVISRLDRSEELAWALTEIANQPHRIWVTPVHYHKVVSTLIWTLRKGLGNDWTAAVEDAWMSCIKMVESLNETIVSRAHSGA